MTLNEKINRIELITTEEKEDYSVPFESPGTRTIHHRNYSAAGTVSNCEITNDCGRLNTILKISSLKCKVIADGCLKLKEGDYVKVFAEEPFKKCSKNPLYSSKQEMDLTGLISFNKKGKIEFMYREEGAKFKNLPKR
ncbi:MAG: hypothetical protein V1886_00030 [archaeon]